MSQIIYLKKNFFAKPNCRVIDQDRKMIITVTELVKDKQVHSSVQYIYFKRSQRITKYIVQS